MRMIEMKRTDLGELYILLEMYGRTYGGVPENLLERIKCAYSPFQAVCVFLKFI